MKKFIIKIFVFSIIFTIFYCFMIVVFGKYKFFDSTIILHKPPTGDFQYTRLEEVKDFNTVDVLFVGSSHAYRGFDTSKFPNIRTFNLGSSSQTHIQTNVLIRRYLENLQPRLVVYEVYPELFNNDGVESALQLVSLDRFDRHVIIMNFIIRDIRLFNTSLYKLLASTIGFHQKYDEPLESDNQWYVPGGYVRRQVSYYENGEMFEKYNIEFNKSQLHAFKNTLRILKNKQIPVLLVFAPITKARYSRYINIEEFDEYMATFSTYYNFNNIIDLSDNEHFYDSHHMNQYGVEQFNNTLLKFITEVIE